MTTVRPSSPVLGITYMIGAGFGFSAMVAFVKAATVTIPVPEVVSIRSAVTAISITLFMALKGIPFRGNNISLLAIRSVTGSISIGLAFYAASVIPLVDMSIIVKTSVIFTALFAAFWLKEPPTKNLYFYTLLAFVGIALIVKPTGEVIAFGGFAALLAAMMIGMIGAIIRKLQETENSLFIVFCYSWTATLSYALLFGSEFSTPTTTELLYMLGAGAAGTLGQVAFTLGYKYAPASHVSPFLYSEVIFAALFGAVYFEEIPDQLTIIGTIIAIYSGIAIARSSRKAATLRS